MQRCNYGAADSSLFAMSWRPLKSGQLTGSSKASHKSQGGFFGQSDGLPAASHCTSQDKTGVFSARLRSVTIRSATNRRLPLQILLTSLHPLELLSLVLYGCRLGSAGAADTCYGYFRPSSVSCDRRTASRVAILPLVLSQWILLHHPELRTEATASRHLRFKHFCRSVQTADNKLDAMPLFRLFMGDLASKLEI